MYLNYNQIYLLLLIFVICNCNINNNHISASSLVIKRSNAFVDLNNLNNNWELNSVLSLNSTSEHEPITNFKLQIINKDLIINDNNNNQWKLKDEKSKDLLNYIDLEIEKKLDINLPLEFIGNFENAYDNIVNEYYLSLTCVSNTYKTCCKTPKGDVSHSLGTNKTTNYKIFNIKSAQLNLNIKPTSLFPSSSSHSSSSASISVIDTSNLDYLNNYFYLNYIVFEINQITQQVSSTFFIPKMYIGDEFNKIGILKDTFTSTNLCSIPYVSVITVGNSSNMYDQFESFRNNTVDVIIAPNCDFKFMDIQSPDCLLTLSCDLQYTYKFTKFSSTISMNFNRDLFSIINSTAVPIISGGVIPLSTLNDNLNSFIYIDILNKGNDNSLFKIIPLYCRNDNNYYGINNDELLIETEKSIIVNNNGYKRRVEFSVKSRMSDPISTFGYCKFSIYQNDQYNFDFIANFSTTVKEYTPNPNNIISNVYRYSNLQNEINAINDSPSSNSCQSPKIFKSKDGIDYCIEACTIDQTFNSLTLACTPVACYYKYISEIPPRNYYNSKSGLCDTVPNCPNGYIFELNSCVAPKSVDNNNNGSSNTSDDSLSNIDSSFENTFPPLFSNGSDSYSNVLADDTSSGPSTALIIIIFVIASILMIIISIFICKKYCCQSKKKKREYNTKQFYDNSSIRYRKQKQQQQLQQNYQQDGQHQQQNQIAAPPITRPQRQNQQPRQPQLPSPNYLAQQQRLQQRSQLSKKF